MADLGEKSQNNNKLEYVLEMFIIVIRIIVKNDIISLFKINLKLKPSHQIKIVLFLLTELGNKCSKVSTKGSI